MGGGKPQRDGIMFMGEVEPPRQHVKILSLQLEKGQVGWNGQKRRQEKVYISCNYSCNISFLVKILLVKVKYLYSVYLNLNHEETK